MRRTTRGAAAAPVLSRATGAAAGIAALVLGLASFAALSASAATPTQADYQLTQFDPASFGSFTYARTPQQVDKGIVIGSVHGRTGFLRGWVWDRGVLTELGHGTGADAVPYAINASGLIAGATYAVNSADSPGVPVTWSASAPAVATPMLIPVGASGATPQFVNDSGQIVAKATFVNATTHATTTSWFDASGRPRPRGRPRRVDARDARPSSPGVRRSGAAPGGSGSRDRARREPSTAMTPPRRH